MLVSRSRSTFSNKYPQTFNKTFVNQKVPSDSLYNTVPNVSKSLQEWYSSEISFVNKYLIQVKSAKGVAYIKFWKHFGFCRLADFISTVICDYLKRIVAQNARNWCNFIQSESSKVWFIKRFRHRNSARYTGSDMWNVELGNLR